jgi:hypothetical protein
LMVPCPKIKCTEEPRMSHNIKDLLRCRHGILIGLSLLIDRTVVSTHLPICVVAMYILFGKHDSG